MFSRRSAFSLAEKNVFCQFNFGKIVFLYFFLRFHIKTAPYPMNSGRVLQNVIFLLYRFFADAFFVQLCGKYKRDRGEQDHCRADDENIPVRDILHLTADLIHK